MDTISTGIGGALLGRALPERWRGPNGTLAVTLAAVLPDADVLANPFLGDELARIAQHRSFTHSLAGVALMAPLAALLLWRFGRDKNYTRLLALFLYGFLWHLFTDLATSWGTQVLYPFSRARVVWDWLFIIDFSFTSILLLPLLVAWVHRAPPAAGRLRRGGLVWLLLVSFTALIIALASPFFGLGFQWGLFALLGAVLGAVFLAPALGGWGFRQSPAVFARLGVAALVAYIGVCAVSHHVALRQVEKFASSQRQPAETIAALPQPLSPFRWSGYVLISDGVYQSWFNVLDSAPPKFEFFPSENNDWVVRAKALPATQEYLWFARFPVARYREEGGRHVVEWTDRRFQSVRQRRPAFAFRVVFNERGEVLHAGFPED